MNEIAHTLVEIWFAGVIVFSFAMIAATDEYVRMGPADYVGYLGTILLWWLAGLLWIVVWIVDQFKPAEES